MHIRWVTQTPTHTPIHTHTDHIWHDLFMNWQSPFRVLLLQLTQPSISMTIFKSKKQFIESMNSCKCFKGEAGNWARIGGKGHGGPKHCNSFSLFSATQLLTCSRTRQTDSHTDTRTHTRTHSFWSGKKQQYLAYQCTNSGALISIILGTRLCIQ